MQLSRTAAYKSMKVEQSLTLDTKINSKWLKDLNTRCDTVKLLGENTDKTLSDINHSNVLIAQSPKAIENIGILAGKGKCVCVCVCVPAHV